MSDSKPLDIVIVGGGVSGTALLYALSVYSNIGSILLIEKESEAGQINSKSNNNSQTLHVGDIETNYSSDKARQVKAAAGMVREYAMRLPQQERSKVLFPVQKMVLAVGAEEVNFLDARFKALKELFPDMKKLERDEIEEVEPNVVKARSEGEPILALRNDGYAVDYEMLAKSLLSNALRSAGERAAARFSARVVSARHESSTWELTLESGEIIRARTVVFDADAYSLLFAKRLGYGRHFSLIPVAGTFFFSPGLLRGKVYTVQDPRLPFSAVHGDPDVRVPHVTRWGPTARFFPSLESRNLSSALDYFKVSGLHRLATWVSFAVIVFDPLRAWYLFRNIFYEIPYFGRYFFSLQVRKIVPSIRWRDLTRARGFGGMRLQRVDTRTRELLLGEGKIEGDRAIFNMTPSPGASVCLYNALRDSEALMKFFDGEFSFQKERMEKDLCPGTPLELGDPSLESAYVS